MPIEIILGPDLRDHAADPDALCAIIAFEKEELAKQRLITAADPSEVERGRVARAAQRLSEHLRLVGELDEALELNEQASQAWAAMDKKMAYYLCRLKGAVIVQYLGRAEQAEAVLRGLLEERDAQTSLYEDFVREALGRLLWEVGEVEAGREQISMALALRIARKNAGHIAYTQQLQERLEARA
ncbi:MAG: hypothetical protein H0U74_05810 [Bradymonadaceae bacterium]|nr:hypothetical protein [Lujinxingiaceae bacterium]